VDVKIVGGGMLCVCVCVCGCVGGWIDGVVDGLGWGGEIDR